MTTTAAPFFTSRVLQTSDYWLAAIFVFLAIGLVFSQPAWLKFAARYDKRVCFIFAAAFYVIISLSWLAAGPGESVAAFISRSLLLGIASGGLILMSQSMLPDTIEYDYLRTGMRREGAFSGIYTTIEKGATALGIGITGLILGATGYIESTVGDELIQPASALWGIQLSFAVVPALLLFGSIAFATYYRLDEAALKSAARA
jgi:GPH family glycoside/pentoside/hexuronide:cation symporter